MAIKLLVVEDDLASLELMAEVFTSLRVDVRPISDSEKAADLVCREKFDGIFLDLEMPKLTGFDLARLVRKSSWNRSTPIVIVTGQDDRETMQQSFAAGANFFLHKPIDRQKLSKLFRAVEGGMVENQRKAVRVPMQTDVICTVGSRSVRGLTWNLSQSGMQVEVSGLRSKDAVKVSFLLPVSSQQIDASGTVIWANERRQGIRFTQASETHQQAIQQFITEVERDQ